MAGSEFRFVIRHEFSSVRDQHDPGRNTEKIASHEGTPVQIHANNLALSAGRGPVYGPLTFELDGGLNVLRGDAGSGRTSLLLTLAGRMKHQEGSLQVGGHELPQKLRAVQKISSVAGFDGIDELEESVTVGAALKERLAWISPWWSRVRKLNDVDVAEICAPTFGGEPIPHANTVIWDLSDTQAFLLRIALAMMSNPAVLLVDDLEQIRNSDSRTIIWDRLAHLAGAGTDVVVSASSLDAQLWDQLDIAPNVVDISTHQSAPGPQESAESVTPSQQELIEETV
ncbi:AAA family ATPase [Arthrobacter glacialis]|nr:AAA family ATPase [Arthrobacter glacialis]